MQCGILDWILEQKKNTSFHKCAKGIPDVNRRNWVKTIRYYCCLFKNKILQMQVILRINIQIALFKDEETGLEG